MSAALVMVVVGISLPVGEQLRASWAASRSRLWNGFPPIGGLTAWDRLCGWGDVRCRSCGVIVGNAHPRYPWPLLNQSTATCSDCTARVV